LLNKDQTERLGTGQKGSGNDFEALKSHPFFNGIKWDELDKKAPPIEKAFVHSPKAFGITSFSPKTRKKVSSKLLSPVQKINKKQESFDEQCLPFKIHLNPLDSEEELLFQCTNNITI
jgi:hypothetical protein